MFPGKYVKLVELTTVSMFLRINLDASTHQHHHRFAVASWRLVEGYIIQTLAAGKLTLGTNSVTVHLNVGRI